MAAPKGKDTLNKLFDEIMIEIAEQGKSAISALKGKMSTATFYELLSDEEKLKRYARATEMRADRMADEMLQIADNYEHDITIVDGREVTDHAVVNRDRLRVDSRKWLLSKLQPKKYGEKIDMTSDGRPITTSIQVEIINSASQIKPDDTGS